MSVLKKVVKIIKNSKITDWLEKVFKYQLGKIIGLVYKDATISVEKTKDICEWIKNSNEDIDAIKNIAENTYGLELTNDEIFKIKNDDFRVRFYIAKKILITQLKKDGREYKEYLIDTIIQLAYVYIKERS